MSTNSSLSTAVATAPASVAVEAADGSRLTKVCPVCRSRRLHYLFSVETHRIVRCDDCDLMLLNPQPSNAQLAEIYGKNYFILAAVDAGGTHVGDLKGMTAEHYLDLLAKYRGKEGGRLLEIGSGQGDFLVKARQRGYQVTGVEYSPHACETARQRLHGEGEIVQGEIDRLAGRDGLFDVCAFSDLIEHVRDPRKFMEQVRSLLAPGGTVFIATPSLDSWSAGLLKHRWMEFKVEHLTYFSRSTLESLLFDLGFHGILHERGKKTLSIEYIAGHFEHYPIPGISPLVKLAKTLTPGPLRRRPFPIVASGMVMLASSPAAVRPKVLSLIVPAFNEAGTIVPAIERLLTKQIDGLQIEIVVVESNSTDGTREKLAPFASHPRVRLIFEDRPRGKGHAVRTGLKSATGDFVMIQDADLEYDLEDYEALLEPLVNNRAAFVLGARHGGKAWKMRQFSGQPLVSLALNFGHWFFTWLLNVCFLVNLRDPFTMYKVFRRDCLHGLQLECNRFDFDWELVIKLIRKGYHPIEIPVNYRSRSFKEGKKVSVIRDPLTWFWAVLKFRFARVNPSAVHAEDARRKVPPAAN